MLNRVFTARACVDNLTPASWPWLVAQVAAAERERAVLEHLVVVTQKSNRQVMRASKMYVNSSHAWFLNDRFRSDSDFETAADPQEARAVKKGSEATKEAIYIGHSN